MKPNHFNLMIGLFFMSEKRESIFDTQRNRYITRVKQELALYGTREAEILNMLATKTKSFKSKILKLW